MWLQNYSEGRLTAKGFTQTKHLNYELIFSPVVRFATVRFLIALAAKYDLELDQMDVGNAFVTSDLDTTDLYMEIPPWFKYLTTHPDHPRAGPFSQASSFSVSRCSACLAEGCRP